MLYNHVVLLLGTNVGDKKKNIENAHVALYSVGLLIENHTIVLENQPVEFTSENLFFNQIIEAKTSLSPIELLKKIKKIEQDMGRKYAKPLDGEIYTDRLIDIDILYYNRINYVSKDLVIPHPRAFTRKFVLDLLSML
ncbi:MULTISPECIES: 2-amino-4-hydroxy-6-hydroxymethyldihydropteridine diphosphokinase [Weeksella]|uniref:2-amino-4-hydroxy-6-hydroxymethyldihydropteridine pyrophosphokinase n=1 Tax=Weeksella virosa (strain ATCC 43766 / DSM 16922 / JCM 21250 / CCUG 30538 / CDC 9751 / IAM 14551 / NBRC 16016 / NCTC 11634 / CL345/78) TaxID=865938 RepID=F0NYN5_WEEVC|nr:MULTISPECIES: 2-amino-4-hydroxy-6-hydroxymethyldihydropteridine diphosphokinase [Weeksella]ADX68166.1 2-amino-4-hydroxy-6-hydroxymethyldihydropteridine pyrophosphokinase [Weeksella virosa DSM 16922]MDK7374850.1 2-amino-4-hydroxy-6-hydroxymethyldihydropteridine diphosphokinase [Weeksella virosa]MDK7675507.1 2-amino-4-hydroxy-6-hydroxymethyldihydropteridine diphosphokinase [Weeksella virosa]OFM83951.1 hypothetical protein HMPREF2660_10565 [Weeksella sp. HMSC059D05]SUP54477.1 Bifunctional fola